MSPPHSLTSEFVRDSLLARTVHCNDKRYHSDGAYVLYWMQSTHRLTENWALRAAIRTANRINRPLVIHQGLDPTYLHASNRHHTFILQGARDTARQASALGLHYHFVLRRRRNDDRRVVDRLAQHAYVVFTDLFPTAGVHERTLRLADRVSCRVLAVDSVCTVPSGIFEKAEYAARTIRPKLAKLLDHAIESVHDDVPHVAISETLQRDIADILQCTPLPLCTMSDADIAREVDTCEIDHTVGAVPMVGGSAAAEAQLQHFATSALHDYAEQRNEASNASGTSALSPYLHYGQIASAHVVRTARAQRAPAESLDAFIQQVTTWRELSYNWCVRTPGFDTLAALPN